MLQLLKRATPTQWIIVGIATVGFVNGSTAQLTEWFGPHVTHNIISALGFAQGLVAAWVVALTSQGSLLKAVAAMPGVDSINIGKGANQVAAQIALSTTPDSAKIEASPGTETKLVEIAKGSA